MPKADLNENKKIDPREPVVVNIPRIPGEPNYVVVWVNEENWKVMKGCDVTVPYCVYDVLKQSDRARERAYLYEDKL